MLEHFGVTERDPRTPGARDAQAQPAHEILTEVEDRRAVVGRDPRDRMPLLDPPHGGRDPRTGNRLSWIHARRRPRAVIEPRFVPFPAGRVDGLRAGVVGLAGIEPAGKEGAGGCRPRRIRAHPPTRSIGELEKQLRGDPRLVSVTGAGVLTEAEVLGRPQPGRAQTQAVAPGTDERGDLDGVVHRARRVGRPPRREHVIVDVAPVDGGPISAHGARVEQRTHHRGGIAAASGGRTRTATAPAGREPAARGGRSTPHAIRRRRGIRRRHAPGRSTR